MNHTLIDTDESKSYKDNKNFFNKDLALSLFVLLHIFSSRFTYFGIWKNSFDLTIKYLNENFGIVIQKYINTNGIEYLITWLIVLFYLIFGIFKKYYDINKNKFNYIIYIVVFILFMLFLLTFILFPRNPLEPLEYYKQLRI